MTPSGAPAAGGRRRTPLNSEINVTPFVDVMLVLLIIFMVAAPLMTVGVQVDLPQADLAGMPPEDQPLDVFIKSDGSVFLGERPVTAQSLRVEMSLLPMPAREKRVRVRADRDVDYGQVMAVIEVLAGEGFARVGLVAAPRIEGQAP